MANDNVMCLSCTKLVPEDSQAICNVICVTGGLTLRVWGSPKQLTNWQESWRDFSGCVLVAWTTGCPQSP